MDFKSLERDDGQGQYLWDPWLWILAAGAIAFLVAFVFALAGNTPPPLGG